MIEPNPNYPPLPHEIEIVPGFTLEDFNKIAYSGLAKVYFLPPKPGFKATSADLTDTIERLAQAMNPRYKTLSADLTPDPAFIVLPVNKEQTAHFVITRDGECYGFRITQGVPTKTYQEVFNLNMPPSNIQFIKEVINSIAKGLSPASNFKELYYLLTTSEKNNVDFIDPKSSPEAPQIVQEMVRQAIKTAKELKKEGEERMNETKKVLPELKQLLE